MLSDRRRNVLNWTPLCYCIISGLQVLRTAKVVTSITTLFKTPNPSSLCLSRAPACLQPILSQRFTRSNSSRKRVKPEPLSSTFSHKLFSRGVWWRCGLNFPAATCCLQLKVYRVDVAATSGLQCADCRHAVRFQHRALRVKDGGWGHA